VKNCARINMRIQTSRRVKFILAQFLRQRKGRDMEKRQGKPLPLGVTVTQEQVNFAVAVPQGKECNLLLYRTGEKKPYRIFPMEEVIGEVRAAALAGISTAEYEYNYEIDGKVYADSYTKAFSGREIWCGKNDIQKHEIRSRIYCGDYNWEGDRPLGIPYHEIIAYALHIRGFTKDPSSKVKNKGTFQGVVEKLSYLKELGINQIQCMPVYEFEERGRYTNYWGYGEGWYFAPKSAYSADGDGVKGLKSMVKACHKAGIEVVLEMPFSVGVSGLMVEECLRFYVMEYHIDGFILNPYVVSMESLYRDPILKKTKLIRHQEGFQNVMRRFLKGDEGMIGDVIYWLRRHSGDEGGLNCITSHTGFTLQDLVSYDSKHNEPNGENNQDGPDYNFSWNCGVEGPSRRKSIVELRKGQIRNAFFLLLLAQGTPCILSGDEFGNSQRGNNNAYCQDNPVGWVNWKTSAREQEMCTFVKKLIRLRQSYPVLTPKEEPLGIDRAGCGVPDVSYHGEAAWCAPTEVSSRQLGVYYSAAMAGGDDCFVIYNMHWLSHEFALPALPGRKKWHLLATTQEGILEEGRLLKDQRRIELGPRTIFFIAGRQVNDA